MWHFLVQTSMPPRRPRVVRRVRVVESGHSCGGETPPPPPPPPQYMPDLRLFWDALLAAAPRPAEHAPVVGCSFVHFSRHNSPNFYGDERLIADNDGLPLMRI
jgi:hypothetical protein